MMLQVNNIAKQLLNSLNPPTSAVLERVLSIRCNGTGSAFFIELNKKQYIVTAAHVVDEKKADEVNFYIDGRWQNLQCKIIGIDHSHDVAVLASSITKATVAIELDHSALLAQQVYFLGFPFTDHINVEIVNQGRLPIPFVKRATISLFDNTNNRLVLDGINNIGFSGGPVTTHLASGKEAIIGIVTGLKEEGRFISTEDTLSNEFLEYKQNTGLMYASNISVATELISQNPNGTTIG